MSRTARFWRTFKAAKVAIKAFKVWRAVEKAETLIRDTEEAAKVAEGLVDAKRAEAIEAATADDAKAVETVDPADPSPAGGCEAAHSFLAGTPVRLASGASKPISQVKAGDKVLATDPQTGLTRPETVVKVIVTHTDEDFTDLSIAAPNAHSPPQKITTTWHHPFWDATHHRWTNAHDLTPGTHLRRPDGTLATVLTTRNYHRHATTYDLTVAGLHSYYVLAGTAGVLVHNCGDASTGEVPSGQGRASQDPAALPDIPDPAGDGYARPAVSTGDTERIRDASQKVGDEAKARVSNYAGAPGHAEETAHDLGHVVHTPDGLSSAGVVSAMVVARLWPKIRDWWLRR